MGLRVSGSFVLPVAPRFGARPSTPAISGTSTSSDAPPNTASVTSGLLKRDCNFLHIAHGVVRQEALAYYHSAPIGLNIHADSELSWEPRVQQLMTCGLLVVSRANLVERRFHSWRTLRANKQSV